MATVTFAVLSCAGIGASLAVGFRWGQKALLSKMRVQLKELDFYKSLWREQRGKNKELGDYHLISLDGGKTWIAVEQNDNGFRICGELEPHDSSKEQVNTQQDSERESDFPFNGKINFHSPAQSEIYRKAKDKFRRPAK